MTDKRYLDTAYDGLIWGIGVPVIADGKVAAAMNVMFLRSAMSLDAGIAELVPVLQTAAREIGNAVAHHAVGDAARTRPMSISARRKQGGTMTEALQRSQVFPEKVLPDAQALIAEARETARTVTVGASPFLATFGVGCEIDYKRRCTAEQRVMMHAQIGFRDVDKSRRGVGGDLAGAATRPAIASTATASAWTGAWAIRRPGGRTCRAAPASS